MPDEKINLERAANDHEYRREVIERLNRESSGSVEDGGKPNDTQPGPRERDGG